MMRTLLTALLSLILAGSAYADVPAVLTWEANQEADLAGYHIYQSTVSGQYGPPTKRVTGTTHTLSLPELTVDTRYFFTVTAIDLASNESAKSDEVSKLVPAKAVIVVVPVATPKITLSAVSETSLDVSWEPLPADTRIDIRIMPAPMRWGKAPSVSCVTSPCTIPGLTPGTAYEALAIGYTGTLNMGATFGPFSAVANASTLAPIDQPPAPPKGLIISKSTETEIVITASVEDCPRITTSTNGSTALVLKRTVRCVKDTR